MAWLDRTGRAAELCGAALLGPSSEAGVVIVPSCANNWVKEPGVIALGRAVLQMCCRHAQAGWATQLQAPRCRLGQALLIGVALQTSQCGVTWKVRATHICAKMDWYNHPSSKEPLGFLGQLEKLDALDSSQLFSLEGVQGCGQLVYLQLDIEGTSVTSLQALSTMTSSKSWLSKNANGCPAWRACKDAVCCMSWTSEAHL